MYRASCTICYPDQQTHNIYINIFLYILSTPNMFRFICFIYREASFYFAKSLCSVIKYNLYSGVSCVSWCNYSTWKLLALLLYIQSGLSYRCNPYVCASCMRVWWYIYIYIYIYSAYFVLDNKLKWCLFVRQPLTRKPYFWQSRTSNSKW